MRRTIRNANGEILGTLRAPLCEVAVESIAGSGRDWSVEVRPADMINAGALLIRDRSGQTVGRIAEEAAGFLIPLLEQPRIRVMTRTPRRVGANAASVDLDVFLLGPRAGFLQADPDANSPAAVVHEQVKRVFRLTDYAEYGQAATVCRAMVAGIRQAPFPETQLLLALLEYPAQAEADRQQEAEADGDAVAEEVRLRLAETRLGDPIHFRNLTVFPLSARNGHSPLYALLQPSMDKGAVIVEEVSGGGSVPEVLLHNQGDLPVLVPEGEILMGAKQNRTINISVLVAAHTRFRVDVSCVEQGRWQARSRRFQSAHYASPSIRARKTHSSHQSRRRGGRPRSDQGEVWMGVDQMLRSADACSATASLTDGYEERREALDAYREELILPEGSTGALFASGDRILGLDLFDCAETFDHYRDRILDAYALESLASGETQPVTESERARRFLHDVGAGARRFPTSLGMGAEIEIAGAGLAGTGVYYGDRLCHLAAFTT